MRDCIKKAENVFDRFRAKKCSYMISYTVLFAVSALLVYGYFALYRKTMVWDGDGIKQHYNALLYISRYLRQVAKTFLLEHRLELPQWDYYTGYGSDILTTYHYYGIGDPFILLSIFVPMAKMESFYGFLFFERLFIGGLGFSYFSFIHGHKRSSTLIGAMIYCFAAFPMVLGIMHSCFLIPVAYFPWILFGAEKIFRKESPAPFIAVIGIAALSNFYFFYMQIVLLIGYCIFRYFRIYGKIRVKEMFMVVVQFLSAGVIGILISLPILLPNVLVTLSSGRLSAKNAVPLFYNIDYYLRFFADFMNTQRPGAWSLMGYTSVGLFSVLVLFFHKEKKWNGYRIVFLTNTLMILVPVCGYALTGFSYVTNRWTWAYGLCVGMIAAEVLPKLYELTRNEKRNIAIASLICMCIAVFFAPIRSEETMISYALLLALVSIFWLFSKNWKSSLRWMAVISIFFLFSAAANGTYRYSITEGNALDNYLDKDTANDQLLAANADSLLNLIGDESVYRIDESSLSIVQNSAIQRKKRASAFYFSLVNGGDSEFTSKLFFNTTEEWNYNGVGSRSALELLTGVKYYLSGEGGEGMIPALFTEKVAEGDTPVGKVSVWKDPDALPLGYTYDSYVPYESFCKMSITERSSALLSGAVVEKSSLPEKEVTDRSVSVLKNIDVKGNAQITDNSFTIGKGGSIIVTLDSVKDSELHVIFENLNFEGMRERDSYSEAEWGSLTEYEKQKIFRQDSFYSGSKESSIMINDGTDQNIVGIVTPGATTYSGRHDFLCNMGYDEESATELTMTFRNVGTYTFDRFDVVAEPMSEVREAEQALGKEVLSNVVEGTDVITGDIEISSPKILVLSMPYRDGWRAWVDGKETDIKRANVMFMGLELEKGSHHIELRYSLPYKRVCIAGFVIGLTSLIFIIVWFKNRKHVLLLKRGLSDERPSNYRS